MPDFMDDDFLLPDRASRRLYHGFAEGMPILDFHCHLPARDIADNRAFASITEAWLSTTNGGRCAPAASPSG